VADEKVQASPKAETFDVITKQLETQSDPLRKTYIRDTLCPDTFVAFVIFCKKYVRLRALCVSVVNFVFLLPLPFAALREILASLGVQTSFEPATSISCEVEIQTSLRP
jgi:hypothetical protein